MRPNSPVPGEDTKILDRLLCWLALYVVALAAICALVGKLSDAIPVVTNLISGFTGGALTALRITSGAPPKDKDGN